MLQSLTNDLELRDILKISGTVIIIGLFATYLAFQARFLITGPELSLDKEPPVNSTTRS